MKLRRVSKVIIEIPQIYPLRQSKGGLRGQNILVDLAYSAGMVAGHLCSEYKVYRPREWKGQVPKDVMVERIKKRVTDKEKATMNLPKNKSKQHNVWDGVGVGLKYFGRL